MDIVYIHDLRIETIIGIYDWERECKQIVSLDLEMGTNIRLAAASEDIHKTLDYKSVSKRLISFIEESEFLLIETMAERIAQIVLEEFDVPWLRLRVGKPGAVTGAKDVGVIIERGTKILGESAVVHTVALSLGSNINPEQHLREALDALQARYGYLRTSSVFESEAVGFSGANFLNMVVLIETEEPLVDLAQFLKDYEDDHGRQRARPKFSGRTVDIDILTFGDAKGFSNGIQLPRAEIVENAYVLWPLSQVCYEELHPDLGCSYGVLWERYDKQRQKLWSVDFNWQGRWISRAGLEP